MNRFILLLFIWTACVGPVHAGDTTLRIATFNIAMGFEQEGEMSAALESGQNQRLQYVAQILQTVRPDIVLLNEFDYDPKVDAATLLNRNYLAVEAGGRQAIHYPWHYRAEVNTGEDSGLDLDGDGKLGGPGDAWGFGRFPGQYGMLVLSRYPLFADRNRTFRTLRWSDLPGARQPTNPDGSPFYPAETWEQLRLSSKSHWDLVFDIHGEELHLLAHHPTPPVFDGPEDRNGLRNFDEIRFWKAYYESGTQPTEQSSWLIDDTGQAGGLEPGARFVIAGDFNADPHDGDSVSGAIDQLLQANWISNDCLPVSTGASAASLAQGGINQQHLGEAPADTADFNDQYTGNLRLDYLLPSATLKTEGCGVFWPDKNEPGHELTRASDHRLVWLDIVL